VRQDLDLGRMVLDDGFGDSTSQGAGDSGFLGSDDATRFLGGPQHGLFVQRFHSRHRDHPGRDAFIFELLGGDQGAPEDGTVADQGDVAAVAFLVGAGIWVLGRPPFLTLFLRHTVLERKLRQTKRLRLRWAAAEDPAGEGIEVYDQLPRRRTSSFAVVLLALLGVALILAAFRVDTPMLSGGNPDTRNGWVHGIAFLSIIAMGVLAPPTMALAVRGDPSWRPIAVVSLAASALFVVFLLLPWVNASF
jgi:hypothetical protein